MTVASGVVPYSYHPSTFDYLFHFRVPAKGLIAPSAILFEEAMYVIKAEYSRLDAGGSVFTEVGDTLGNNDAYRYYLSDSAQGFFDPDPNGRNLDGTNPVPITTTAGGSYTARAPATYHMKAYIVDMRESLREVIAQVMSNADGGLTHWNGVEDYLKIYKQYSGDAFSEGGTFFNEDEHPVHSEPYSSGVLTSGTLMDRHLDEVRYQPMPFLSGVGGSFLAETKGEMFIRPIRPCYWNTSAGLGPGWSTAEAYGDVLVTNAAIMLSGGGASGQLDNRYESLEWTPNGVEDIQQSGSFAPINSMTKGVYISIVGNSGTGNESGLAPWATGYNGFPRVARVPNRDVNLPSGGGQQWSLIVEDDVFVIQRNYGGTGADLGESGVEWRMPMGNLAEQVDFYISNPQNSGIRRLWGNSLYAQKYSELGINDLYRPAGWMYDRANDKIHLVGNSGFATLNNNYPFGTGVITTFSPSMTYETHQTIPEITGTEPIAIKSLESITWDGSNYICHGYAQRSYGGTTSGVVWKLDSSFNAVDMVSGMSIGSVPANVQGKTFWHRGNSEYLFLSNSGSARRILEEYQNRYFASGTYHVATFSWGAFTTPPGTMSVTAHVPTIAHAASSQWGPASQAGIRIVDLFNHEDTDDLYGMALAHDTSAGAGSGGSDNFSRWLVKFDDTGGHPYEISNAWLIGSDDSPNDLNTSIRNSKFMYFMDNFQF